jgi:S-adenosylmethionine decarboxylase
MYLGSQELVEFYNCDEDILKDSDLIKKIFIESAKLGNANIVNSLFHSFSPYGVTGVLVIAESHMSIHTWHEFNYCAVDIFSCCDKLNNKIVLEDLKDKLFSSRYESTLVNRGNKYIIEQSANKKLTNKQKSVRI